MHVRHRFAAILALGFFSLAFLLFAGCCAYVEPGVNGNQTGANQTEPPVNQSTTPPPNRPPVATLLLNRTEAPTPFPMSYTYSCYDPDGNIASCELKIDGRTYAKGENQATLLPKDYRKPDFYGEILKEVGNHTLEITATDSEGLSASQVAEFTVLKGLPLSEPGWYGCNEKPDNPPCDSVMAGYCDKFDEHDMAVRQAAAQAIAKHPGAFSINQLLDIYDYVHANIFYHNVPLDMWPPYYPNQTLATKSGDCKNQAVLIASMVEAIGGTARVLFIPGCTHAYPEVFMGTDVNESEISQAIYSHYNTLGKGIRYHTHTYGNHTDYWFIFDTAGGNFPGETIPECFNASQTFVIRDCNIPQDQVNPPEIQGTAFGPYVDINETKVIDPEWGWNYWHDPSNIGRNGIRWCHFNMSIQSLSPTPFDWYLTNEAGYQKSQAYQSFSYYSGEEQVSRTNKEFDWDTPQKFYIILKNRNKQNSITVKTELIGTCYK